ncbi:hypothetical protein RF11_14631 [Thelohanellus kitauei]|uniref:Uncharacterized protein n=1 Tax=Thelohanellus kitauei TaxID=669202 RepID=A0A0C2NBP8_THEKT|nr:hypothetical protein RF11_14631 [Thelohanellus kitauei]
MADGCEVSESQQYELYRQTVLPIFIAHLRCYIKSCIKCFGIDDENANPDLSSIHKPGTLVCLISKENCGTISLDGYGLIVGTINIKSIKNHNETLLLKIQPQDNLFLASIQDAYSMMADNLDLVNQVDQIKDDLDPKSLETFISKIYYGLQSALSCMFNTSEKQNEGIDSDSDDAYVMYRSTQGDILVRASIVDHKICLMAYHVSVTVPQSASHSNLLNLKFDSKIKTQKIFYKNTQYDVHDKVECQTEIVWFKESITFMKFALKAIQNINEGLNLYLHNK